MTIKKAYYFSFYKFYKSFEASPSRFWSEWKASLLMDVLVGCIVITIGLIYTVVTKKDFIIFESSLYTWIMILIIGISNYFIFNHADKWKGIIADFNHLPKNKNRIGGIIFWSIFFLIIASVVFMFYLMSQIDWKLYK